MARKTCGSHMETAANKPEKKKKPSGVTSRRAARKVEKKKINILYLQVAASFLVPWKGYFKAPQQKPESELPSK